MKKMQGLTPNRKLIGLIKRHPDGYGFFIPDEANVPDVYVAKHAMEGVMTNDKVEIIVKRDGDRMRGEIIKVVERNTKKVTGKLKKINPSQGLLRDEGYSWGEDLKVGIPPVQKVNDGDWVVVKITSFPDSVRGFQGEVETVIGSISDPQSDNLRVLANHNIPHAFSKECLKEAQALPTEVRETDFAGRKDLRQRHFVTIDGKTAKDFDDAILVEKMGGGFRLWVAIADVSHYVRPHTPIDKDAYLRGTSTYFPNFVAPMLPEALSNELCSLKPNVPRLAMVAEMDFNFKGEMGASKFYEAVIQSQARVTYGEAQEVLDGSPPAKLRHVASDIKLAGELSHILMEKRFSDGSLNLEIPESTIELDETGVPTDIIRSERIFAHRLIEELMLAANVAVAKFIGSKKIPGLYRIHDVPKLEAMETLERFLDIFGFSKKVSGQTNLQKKLTETLKAFSGQPQETVINILTLRSMAQARYSPENIGHFGLGFTDYSHFTSPIRRYPDLITHRILKAALGVPGYRKMSFEELDTAGTMLSGCEQRSVKAERQVQAIKKARFMEKHLGQVFPGIITSVTKFGVFVTLRQFEVDGLVKVEELGGEHFQYDEESMTLKGNRSGFTYALGDEIHIQVAAANHELGRVDFVLAPREDNKHAPLAKKKHTTERRETSNDRKHVREVRVSGHRRKDGSEKRRPSGKTSSRRHK